MQTQFEFPINFNDVEQETTTYNRLYVVPVEITLGERQILTRLRQIDSALFESYTQIQNPEHFDFLYLLIKNFNENIEFRSMKTLQRLIETVHHMANTTLKVATAVEQHTDNAEIRTSFKMAMFLVFYLLSTTALKKPKSTGADVFEAMGKEKKKKGKTQYIEVSKAIVQTQKMLIVLMKDALEVNFAAIWELKEVESEFFKKYTETCIKVLESTLGKDDEVCKSVFCIMERIMKAKPELFKSVQIALINLVFENEVPDNLVMFFSKAEGAELQKLCTQTIILIVVHLMQKNNLNAESASVKNTKEFLSRLSERLPKLFYNNLSVFIQLFESESYHLRNAISDIIGNILRFVVRGESEDLIKPRQKFVTTILQRIYDKSSYCRSHILGLLASLAVDKVVPRPFMILFLKAGIDRVKDNSVNTRKRALQLINTLIQELCPNTLKPLNKITEDLQNHELDKKSLLDEQKITRSSIENVVDPSQQQALYNNLRTIKKRVKMIEENEIKDIEERQIVLLVSNVVGTVKVLLGSKNQTDVLQTIRLFIRLNKLNCPAAREVLPNIRLLVFSRQKKIKDQVLSTFMHLHLGSPKSDEVAQELVRLFTGAAPQDISALEEILEIIISESVSKNIVVIRPQVYTHLWNNFIQCERDDARHQEKRVVLTILRVAFSCDPNLVKEQHMESFLNILKKNVENGTPDFLLLQEISRILLLDSKSIVSYAKNFLLAEIFILVRTQGTQERQWYSAVEHVLSAIFQLCQNPEKLTEVLIKKLHSNLEGLEKNKEKGKNPTSGVSQFIFTLSHTCLKMLIHLDNIQNKIKALKNQQTHTEEEESQLDKVMGGAEAQLQRKIQQVQRLSEKMLEDPFIKKWLGAIQSIVSNLGTGNQLEIVAILSYSKFMTISPTYCQQQLPKLLNILSKPKINAAIKNNIIIAVGDLLHRFPNIVEPHSRYLYQNLRDSDPRVRKTTLTVLTHLSLNDMIKVKSDLCEIALLFQDPNPDIESLVKQFFHEMNKKDPKNLFNLIPDALNRFSNTDLGCDQNTFSIFMKNILPLLEKDKYSESLVVKLCERIAISLRLLEVKNTALCLAELNLNQKCVRKVLENFEGIRPKLENADVANHFKNLVLKLKKSMKPELKSLIEELEERINNSNEEFFNADDVRRRNEKNQKKLPRKRRHRKSNKAEQEDEQQVQQRTNRKNTTNSKDQPMDIDEGQSPEQKQRNLRPRKKKQWIQPEDSDNHQIVRQALEQEQEDQDKSSQNDYSQS